MADKRSLLHYLSWALQGLGLESALQVIPSKADFLREFEEAVLPTLSNYLKDDPYKILERAESLFFSFADSQEHPSPSSEEHTYHVMQSAMVASLLGRKEGLAWLGALLITEPINRKLSISHFLGNLTAGSVGTVKKEIPSKSQIIEWASQIKANSVKLQAILPELGKLHQ